MTDIVVRSLSTEAPAQPLPVQGGDDTVGNYDTAEPIAPAEMGEGAVLQALGIQDDVGVLPEADKSNLNEVETYVFDLLLGKGVAPTVPNITKELNALKLEMGLDANAEPGMVLDRIGGVVKAWKNLSFVKDAGEKKHIFFKLANAKSSSDMNRIVFQEMEKRSIWQ